MSGKGAEEMFVQMSFLMLMAAVVAAPAAGPSGAGQYAKLQDVASSYGFPPPVKTGNQLTLRSKWTTMSFETNGRRLTFNGYLLWLHAPLQFRDGSWMLTQTDLRKVIDPLLRSHTAVRSAGNRIVVLDAGHGGKDNGAQAWKLEESHITLDIARRVSRKLKPLPVSVKLTRDKDKYVGLNERCDKARASKADLFVSIHLNSASDKTVSGIETYVLTSPGFGSTADPRRVTVTSPNAGNKYDEASMLLGYCLHSNMIGCTGAGDRGIKRAAFLVLKEASCPTVLLECGFLSNAKDARKVTQGQYLDQVAEGIARGVMVYLSTIEAARYSSAR